IPPKSAVCRIAEMVSGPRHGSRISNTSARILALQWLRYDADICDSRLLYRIHHSGKDTKRNILVSSQINRLLRGILHLLPQLRRDLVHINWITAQKHSLLAVHGNHQPWLRDLFDRSRLRDGNLDARLQYRRRQHEDDEQHEHHIYQWRHIDVGKGGLR